MWNLCLISGAEKALVVNNNAAAVFLCLNTLSDGKEVIVSRGELVEIGGSFRIPDIMKKSGASLKEVGTTNRTFSRDYREAIGSETALLMKVHTSNFSMVGFTSQVSLEELTALGKEYHLPVMQDLGSGSLLDLSKYGLMEEPTVQKSVKTGADIITFSGDKLLGGPQAGIILGKPEYLEKIKSNPLNRALRIDKLTLSALEATLRLYLNENEAKEKIPILKMLTLSVEEIEKRSQKWAERLKEIVPSGFQVEIKDDNSQVGGGALPLQNLPTKVIAITPYGCSLEKMEETLRNNNSPVIARKSKNQLLFDLRTTRENDLAILEESLGNLK